MLLHIDTNTRTMMVGFVLVNALCVHLAVAQANSNRDRTDNANKNKTESSATEKALTAAEEKRLLQYVDKDGGYKDKDGGYYNPKASTYTDKKGGIVDNWQGYTYPDGSSKPGNGNYWDAKTKMVHLAAGDVFPLDASSSEVIKDFRENVEETGGYDKNYIRRSMLKRIALEHPLNPAEPEKRASP